MIVFVTGPDDPCQPYKTTQVTRTIYLFTYIYWWLIIIQCITSLVKPWPWCQTWFAATGVQNIMHLPSQRQHDHDGHDVSLSDRQAVSRSLTHPARPLNPWTSVYMGSEWPPKPAGHENIKGDSDVNTHPNMCLRQMFVHNFIIK